jgi:hypothetical protein
MTNTPTSHIQTSGETKMQTASRHAIPLRRSLGFALPILAGLIAVAFTGTARAQQSFATPEDAVAALVDAAKSDDSKAALKVFGADGEEIISSGDPVNDKFQRDRFVESFTAKHQIVSEGDSKAALILGEHDWPFPVPLVKTAKGWHFDTEAGLQEILFRRIGHNELDTMQTVLAYVDAQNDYAQYMRKTTGTAFYAQHFVSDPGEKNGLYWPTQPGEEQSPLGELVASAATQGYKVSGTHVPYHGYYYKILTRQGKDAPGGGYDYIVKDKMIGGFALIAYPATYRNSGVMTFMVNHDGTVYEKDLGPHTAKIASETTYFNPDETWKKVTVDPPVQ